MRNGHNAGSFHWKELPDRAEDRPLQRKGAAERRHLTEGESLTVYNRSVSRRPVFFSELVCIPEGTCRCAAEGHMALC